MNIDDDTLDGCRIGLLADDHVPDDDLPYMVMAGGLDGEAAEMRIDEYARLFGADDAPTA